MGPLYPLPHTRTPTVRFRTASEAAKYVARELDKLIRSRNAAGKNTVLGLATGSTPVSLYRELIRLHNEEKLDFSRVVTFNLDEYYPMAKESEHSYFRWMHETLFDKINIRPENIHIPDGTLAPEEVDRFGAEYEKKIKAAGGIDVQILGIGRTGHIGFNEPGSSLASRTRVKTLTDATRADNARFFASPADVPRHCLTQGLGTIREARALVLLAFGSAKAEAVAGAVEGPVSASLPGSVIQLHPDVTVLVDEAAAARLRYADYYRSAWEHRLDV